MQNARSRKKERKKNGKWNYIIKIFAQTLQQIRVEIKRKESSTKGKKLGSQWFERIFHVAQQVFVMTALSMTTIRLHTIEIG